jgi:hypothetical protein
MLNELENQEFEEWGLIDVCSISEEDQDVSIVRDAETQEPPPSRPQDHFIVLKPGSNAPLVRGIRRLSQEKLLVLKDTIQDLLDKGFIRPSYCPFGASVLYAKKPDGSYRMCAYYRGLNDITLKDKSP